MSKRHLNLIPAATQRRQAARRAARVFSVWVTAASVSVAAFLAIEYGRGLISARELASIRTRAEPLVELREAHDRLVAEIATLRGREQLSLRLSRDAHGFTLLATLARAAAESQAAVYIDELDYVGPSNGEDLRSVRLTGAGIDSTAVADFAAALRSSGLFESIAVESTQPLRNAPESLRRFNIAGVL